MSMKFGGWLAERLIAGFLVLILAAPSARAVAMPRQDEAAARQEQSAPDSQAQTTETVSGAPVANSSQPDASLPDAPQVALLQSPASNEQQGNPQPVQDSQQNGAAPAQPVGTAAAPTLTKTGVTASKPAGAAIAPAKQRRVRTILISLGVVAAACVAIGTTAGLSHTSPSQPK